MVSTEQEKNRQKTKNICVICLCVDLNCKHVARQKWCSLNKFSLKARLLLTKPGKTSKPSNRVFVHYLKAV